MKGPYQIEPLQPADRQVWQDFLPRTASPTIFHDLDFLDYHPADRFRFHHLLVRGSGGELAGVIPGGLVGDRYVSPLGASVGGPALARDLGAENIVALVRALCSYAITERLRGIDITLPPAAWAEPPTQGLEFALHHCGFRLTRRWMPLMIPLKLPGPDRFEQLFSKRSRPNVRSGRRRGTQARRGGIELLEAFAPLFNETYDRHRATPAHTISEITDLLRRLPDRCAIWLAERGSIAVAGALVFLVTPRVGLTFYLCDSLRHRSAQGISVIVAALVDYLADRDFAYLDLGPSASDGHFNQPVVMFKEGVGGLPFCRDHWLYTA